MANKVALTKAQKKEIEQSIEQLEKSTSGELVVYIAKQSDDYSDAIWYFSALQSLFFAAAIGLLSYYWLLPINFGAMETAVVVITAGLLGILFPLLIPRLRIFLMKNESVEQRVNTRAHDVFLQQELFNTADRIGILFYISALEHKITVLADAGINQKIDQASLNRVVSEIATGIKHNKFADGIHEAIKDCESLLLEHGFNHEATTVNELANHVISEFD